jgi:bifunctional DNase/RNase
MALEYEYTADSWSDALAIAIKRGYPIYVDIDGVGDYKIYPTGYARERLPNEGVPE